MKVGIFLPHLGNNQTAIQTIATVNKMVEDNVDFSPSLFYKENKFSVIRPRTITTSFDKIYNYDGHLITTNLDTTYIATQCKTLKSINFIVCELEWTRRVGSYLSNIHIYKNKNIHIFVPSKEYNIALENYCNIQAKVLNGLDINEIVNDIRNRN